ncbi:MAG: cation diffusion facilitator family transporter, partial [Oscillospiraceae bacterium]|nr:cation diffusion facilitator family transporter [Oscillospiraceae bacterium]
MTGLFKQIKSAATPAEQRAAYGNMTSVVGILCNVALFAAKLLIGIAAASVSIMADAVNNLTDATSSIVTLLGFRMAAKPADSEHPYGHARMEYFSAMLVAVFILMIAVELAKSSFEKILHP